MKKVFVVSTMHWLKTDDPLNQLEGNYVPVRVFENIIDAESYVSDQMSQFPEDQIHHGPFNEVYYEEPEHEIISYKIDLTPIECNYKRDCELTGLVEKLDRWILNVWQNWKQNECFKLTDDLQLEIEWNTETDQDGTQLKYLDLILTNNDHQWMRESCYTSYGMGDSYSLAEAIVGEITDGSYKER